MENKKNHSILLIDDEQKVLKVLKGVLVRSGYKVETATNGYDAVTLFKEHGADLVMTDIRMPGMDGMDVLQQVKAIDPLAQVIVLTGYGSMDLAIKALKDYDAFDFMTKPKGAPELLSTVEKALEHGDLLRKTERLQKEIQEHNINLSRQNEELRQTQFDLEISHQRYEDLYQNAPVGYITVDTTGNVVKANQTAANMLGLTNGDIENQPFSNLIEPSDLDTYKSCREAVQKDQVHVCEMRLKKSDGTSFSARIETKGVASPREALEQTRVIITDISKQKEIQQQMLESHKLEAIATLAGGIAHQFNNALAGITGYLELMQIDLSQKGLPSTHLPSAFQLVHRMANLTKQLLAYASGGKYAPHKILLTNFIEEMLGLINHNISKGIRIVTDLPENVHWIQADSTQLQMVLIALVQNASEASQDTGFITIRVKNVELVSDNLNPSARYQSGTYVCMSVSDQGCGMDAAMQKKIFDPFFTTKFIGRGLGLSAAHGIINNHNGWIEVDSTPGQGTCVSIYLPAATPTPRAPEPVVGKDVDPDGHDATVLVIEDDAPLRKVTRQLLARLNYQILEAETGKAALEIVNSHKGTIDVVILDMLLPDTDGEHLYHELRDIRPDLKVILCSGYAMDKPVKELIKAGAQGFLPKPYSTKTLASELKRVIEGSADE
jgi:PAS domain S-box-containing protein